jgi:hypothetical protein
MGKRKSASYLDYESENRRALRLRVITYVFLGLLAAVTAIIVYLALTR